MELDKESAYIIQRYYGDWLRSCFTQDNAIELVQTASRHYHQSTQARIAEYHRILLDGVFHQNDSSSAELYRAFLLSDTTPKVVKFGQSIVREYAVFKQLQLDPEDCIKNHIVPVEMYILDACGKTGLLLPMYVCSLSSINSDGKANPDLLEDCIFAGARQIEIAL